MPGGNLAASSSQNSLSGGRIASSSSQNSLPGSILLASTTSLSSTEPGSKVCFLCKAQLKWRRILHCASRSHLVLVLSPIAEDFFGKSAQELLSQGASICLSCQRKVEKLIKLKETLNQTEQEIREQVKRAGQLCGLEEDDTPLPANPSVVRTPSRKRAAEDIQPEAYLAKRSKADAAMGTSTPVRRAIASMRPTDQSPAVAVVVKGTGRRKVRTHLVTRASGLKTLTRSVGRKNRQSIARQVMQDPGLKNNVLAMAAKQVQKEMTYMCSKNTSSMLRDATSEAVRTFTWEALVKEVKTHAPTLFHILNGCAQVKRRVRVCKKGRTRQHAIPSESVVGVCAAILLRNRNVHMNLAQRVISLLLNGGHASKQTYTRLQRMLMCLSHKRTLNYLDTLGKDHDETVCEWRDHLQQAMTTSQLNAEQENPFEFQPDPAMQSCSGMDVGLPACVNSPEPHTPPPSPPPPPSPLQHSDADTESSSTSPSSSLSSPSTDDQSSSSHISTPVPSELTFSETSSVDLDAFLGPEPHPHSPTLKTYKLVGDNIDKNVRPHHMRSDHQVRSLHYFHTYAVSDRVDLSGYSTDTSVPDLGTVQVDNFFPTTRDEQALRTNYGVLVGRTLVKYLPYFKQLDSLLPHHILHEYSSEMSVKSEVVPLGIFLKGEQKYEEMVQVLDHLHQYVPTLSEREEIPVPTGSLETYNDTFDPLLLGGDQMTASRTRGSQRIRLNAGRGKERLEGLSPVVEDWHAKVCLLEVIWKHLFSGASRMDVGTLYQLRNVINRRNVVKSPSENVSACENFFTLVVEAHIIAATMEVFEMNSTEDIPSRTYFQDGFLSLESAEKTKVLMLAISAVIEKFIDTSYGENRQGTLAEEDHIQAYASNLLNVGLLFMEFNDGIREGDGNRILRCWRYFLLHFKISNRTNYSVEAFNLLSQYHFWLSPRSAMQLIWSRTVNTHGYLGKNIPCDLHMEHLNREAKSNISGLGSNITDESVIRIGNSIGQTVQVLDNFDKVNCIKKVSDRHSKRSCEKDMAILLNQLCQDGKVFQYIPGRSHRNFVNIPSNPLNSVSANNIAEWMKKQLTKLASKL